MTRLWPAVLGAAIILSACASSSTPSAAPAPAPGPTVPAALGGLSIDSHEQYYDIEGSSAGALREAIHRLGPRDGSEARDALTVWTLDWTYGEAPGADGCGLRNLRVTLNVDVTLPRWAPAAGTPPRLIASWRSYLQHVKAHEAGHRAIAERNARDLLAALAPLRAATCPAVSDAASRTAERVVADGRARNRAYDVETKHGQTQGVELRP